MATTDTEIGQAPRHLHAQICQAILRAPPDLLDHPTPFDPGHHVVRDDPRPGAERIAEPIPEAPCRAWRLVCGGLVSAPAGAAACKPVSLSSVAWPGEAIGASSAACLSCVVPALGGRRATTVPVCVLTCTLV